MKAGRNKTYCYHTAANYCKWKPNESENNDIQAR